ncbi:MAG: DUF1841 family protein [Pseudonocardiaceae bacterium]
MSPSSPDREESFARLLRVVGGSLVELRDPLKVEMVISELIGTWSDRFPVDADHDPEVVLGEGFIAHAERCGSPAAQAMLRGLAALGTDGQRSLAGAAAGRLAACGVAEPAWVGELDGVTVTGCRAYRDVYGDETGVVLNCERDGQRHAVVVLVDHTGGGIARDAFVARGPVEAVDRFGAGAAQPATYREISPAEARGIVEPALADDRTLDPPLGETYRATRALALARLRVLPPAQPPPDPVDLAPAERAEIVADFLALRQGAGLADRDAVQRCAELIVAYSCEYDNGQVLRVSPRKIKIFLLGWLPLQDLSDRERDTMPAVVAAWVGWAAERGGLPEQAHNELARAAAELGEHFPVRFVDPRAFGPTKSWLAGLGDAPDVETVRTTLDRRTFVMPYYGIRIGGTDYPQLDANDEEQRRLLIIGEHPQFHEVLGGPDPDSIPLADRAIPVLHVGMHEIVATQLWNDDPPETWQAAQRLTAAGVERHDVLHALTEVVMRHLPKVQASSDLAADESYRRDLESLNHPSTPLPRSGSDR